MTVRAIIKDEKHLLLMSLVLLLAAALVINAIYITNQLKAAQAYNGGHVLTSSQTAQTPELAAAVKNVSESDKIDIAFTLPEGETMLVMDFSITNHTKSIQDFIPTSQLYVRTRVGDYRPLHPSLKVKNAIKAGQIAPGETISGQISFGVPKAATNPLLFVDTGWEAAAPVVFDVLK